MSKELIKSENKILVGTSFEGLRLREETTDSLKSTLYDCLVRGYKVSKTQTTINLQEEIQSNVEILSTSVKDLHGGITLTELSKALTNGFMGVYGDYYGVTPLTVMNFLKKYSESDERKRAVQESKRLKDKQQSKPDQEMTIDQKRDYWNEAKAEYKKAGTLRGELFLYKLGRELKLIDLTDDIVLEEIKYKALKWFEGERERLKLKGLEEVLTIRLVEQVLEASEEDRTKLHLWQNRCKRIAVQLTFEN